MAIRRKVIPTPPCVGWVYFGTLHTLSRTGKRSLRCVFRVPLILLRSLPLKLQARINQRHFGALEDPWKKYFPGNPDGLFFLIIFHRQYKATGSTSLSSLSVFFLVFLFVCASNCRSFHIAVEHYLRNSTPSSAGKELFMVFPPARQAAWDSVFLLNFKGKNEAKLGV